VQVNIKNLIDEVQCYQTVRDMRWPDGVTCPSCQSIHVIKRGFDDTEPARQRYECHDCDQRFDDLTDTIFAGHHQPLKVWILCLYQNMAEDHTYKGVGECHPYREFEGMQPSR
jgi:transposase-like protein